MVSNRVKLSAEDRRLLALLGSRGGRVENAHRLGITETAYDGRKKRLVQTLRNLAFDVPGYARHADWEAIAAEILGAPGYLSPTNLGSAATDLERRPEDAAVIDRAIDALSTGRHIPFNAAFSHALSRRISDSLTHEQLVGALRMAAKAETLHQAKWPIHFAGGALDAAQRRLQRATQSQKPTTRRAAEKEWAEVCEAMQATITRWTRALDDSRAAPDTTLTELGELEMFLGGADAAGDTMARALNTLAADQEHAYGQSRWSVEKYYGSPAAALLRAYAHLERENLGATYIAIELTVMGAYWHDIQSRGIPLGYVLSDYEQEATLVAMTETAESLEGRGLRTAFEASSDALRSALVDGGA